MKTMAGTLLTVVMLALTLQSGCNTVGTDTTLGPDNAVRAGSSAAHTVSFRDSDKSGVTSGVGPSVLSRVDASGAQTLTSGTPTQTLVVTREDADMRVTFALSGGQDSGMKGVKVDPVTGIFEIAEVTGSASAPIAALEPATIEQIRATKDALIEQIRAAVNISDAAKGLLVTVIEKIAAGGVGGGL